MISTRLKHSLLALSITSILVGCGGSGSNADGSSPTPPQSTPITGRAIDGPLSNATVLFTDCNNQTTTTKENGEFTFPQDCRESSVIISGGIDTGTDLPFTGELKAPKQTPVAGEANKIIVSPITTLISAGGDATEIAKALGLEGKNLLSIDPMNDKEVYAKTVAVQQIVEQIQKTVATLGGSSSQAELNTQAFTALTKALTTSNTPSNALTSVDTIKAAISSTVEAVKETLPEGMKANSANVAANLGTLAATVIATNTQAIEKKITELPATAFNGSVEAVKTETKAVITDAKESVAVEKIVTALAPALTAPPSVNLTQQLQNVSEAVATPSTAPSTAIADAVTSIKTETKVDISDTVVEDIKEANSFYAKYLKLSSFNAQSINYNIAQLNSSLATPIAINNLDNLLVAVERQGTYTSNTVTVGAALQLTTGSNNLAIIADKVDLTYEGSKLTAAVLPAGTSVKIASNLGNSLNTVLTVGTPIDVLSQNQLALNTTTLGKISTSVTNQLNAFNTKGQVVTVTAILTGSEHIAISDKALANKYTINSIQGHGVTAKFTVN